jgi:hypothetical protein
MPAARLWRYADLWLDSDGNALTSAGTITERIRRPTFGALLVDVTIDDPKAYTARITTVSRTKEGSCLTSDTATRRCGDAVTTPGTETCGRGAPGAYARTISSATPPGRCD